MADLFIDDRNIGGLIGWGEIYQMLIKEEDTNTNKFKSKRKSWFSFLKAGR